MKSKRYKIFIHWVNPNVTNDDLVTMIVIEEQFLIPTIKEIVSVCVDKIEVFEDNDM